MLGGHISHHNSHYVSHLLVLFISFLSILIGWSGSTSQSVVLAAGPPVASPIIADPAHTQDFFATFGDATVQRSQDGNWSQVTLTPPVINKAGAVTLNNRVDMTQKFKLAYSVLLGNGKGDGMSFALYPGRLGAVGMFGGNMGVAGLPNVLGFKIDTYWNNTDNVVDRGDQVWGFRTWANGQTNPPISFNSNLYKPATDTVNYAQQMRLANPNGAVWGTVDNGLVAESQMPYGSFIETNGYGYLQVMGANSRHILLGRRMETEFDRPTPTPTLIGGQVIDGSAAINTNGDNFTDSQWHGVQVDYQVTGTTGTMSVRLYKNPDYTGTFREWRTNIDIAAIKNKTNSKPYFALNIAGSNGKSAANQAVKNLYAEYTPEPGAFTTRFVDNNGTTIANAINQGGADDLNQPFFVDIPSTRTRPDNPLQGTYEIDYTILETYNNQNTSLKETINLDKNGSDYRYNSNYTTPYRRLTVHYKKTTNNPEVTSTIKAGTQLITNGTSTLIVDKPNTTVNYTYTLKVPPSAPDPWNKVVVQTMLPVGLKPTTATATSQTGAPITIQTSQETDGRTKLTLDPIDLYGTATSSQPSSVQIQLTFVPMIPLIGTIETTAQDSYKQEVSGTPTSYWNKQPDVSVTPIQITGFAGPATIPIPMPDRAKNREVVFSKEQLSLPAGVTQVTAASLSSLTGGLESPDVKITYTNVENMLPSVAVTLNDSGVKKLTGNDSIMVSVLYSGKDDNNIPYEWMVNYVLYEPLTTWMPSEGLAKTVAAQPELALTSFKDLQKS